MEHTDDPGPTRGRGRQGDPERSPAPAPDHGQGRAVDDALHRRRRPRDDDCAVALSSQLVVALADLRPQAPGDAQGDEIDLPQTLVREHEGVPVDPGWAARSIPRTPVTTLHPPVRRSRMPRRVAARPSTHEVRRDRAVQQDGARGDVVRCVLRDRGTQGALHRRRQLWSWIHRVRVARGRGGLRAQASTRPCAPSRGPARRRPGTSLSPGGPGLDLAASADVEREQVVLGLAPDDHPGRAVGHGHHGRAQHVVVVAGHRAAVGTRRRHGEQVAAA